MTKPELIELIKQQPEILEWVEQYLDEEIEFMRTLAGMEAKYDEMRESYCCVIHGRQDSSDCPRC